MTQILKRLEIVKSSIAIEDEEIIELQIMKLKKLDLDEEVAQIVVFLEQSDFTTALSSIEGYLSRYGGVVKYIDTQLQGLKLQLKTLESKLQTLIEQKTEYLSDIAEFNNEYNLRLGELIRSILSLRKEILYKKTIKQQKQKEKYKEDMQAFEETTQTVDELRSTVLELEEMLERTDDSHEQYDEIQAAYEELLEELRRLEDEIEAQQEELEKAKEFIDDEELQQEYQESKNHYDEFDNNYEDIKESVKNSMVLSEEEKALLKTLYKKAARLCHPDIVPDEQKEKAHELMQQLNDAYSKKEILKVKEILNLLENGSGFELSSDSIDDKEILKAKIDEYKQNIEEIENELEELEEDETYQVIVELDDWDEYFEELKSELLKEKERLEEEAREVLADKDVSENKSIFGFSSNNNNTSHDELTEEWMQTLWDWADENKISSSRLTRKKDTLLATKVLDLTNIKLSYLPKEIANLENLQELILWECGLKYLPKEIVKLARLKKLSLNGNPDLAASQSQIKWMDELSKKSTVYKGDIRIIREETVEMFSGNPKNETQPIKKEKTKTVVKESSPYSKHIQSIENIRFEKIRKYCENLSKANEADEMQKYLGKNGKMHKAIIYDALERFISQLNGDTITIIDWECDQGIASMLVLDYIKEKQLDIEVIQVVLVNNNAKALSRAMVQIEALSQDKLEVIAIKSDDNNLFDTIKTNKNSTILHLVANDKMPINSSKKDNELFDKSYVMCISHTSLKIVEEVYKKFSDLMNIKKLSKKDGNIGKFQRFERILFVEDINKDTWDLPF